MSSPDFPKPSSLAVQTDRIPAEMKALDRWVLWKYSWINGRKWAKTPRRVDGGFAAVNNSATWCSFDDAAKTLEGGDFDGLGIVLPEGVVGVDLDDVAKEDGGLTEGAHLIAAVLDGTYCEYSPSGTGVKFLTYGKLDNKLKKISHAQDVELYDGSDTNRFFALTGHRIDEDRAEVKGCREGLYKIQAMISEPWRPTALTQDRGDVGRAVELLDHIAGERSDAYDEWLTVGMALNSVDKSDEMLEHWCRWSSQSAKYAGEEDCKAKWESFRREGTSRLVTISTLERLAREDGYRVDQYSTGLIYGDELAAKVIKREYLVKDFMTVGEPMIVGGAAKCLKTTISLDLAVSIATGTKFMGRFEVPERRRVAFLSGESGEATLQEDLVQIAKGRDLDSSELSQLGIGFRLPKLDALDCVDDLIAELAERQIGVLFVDPLYRSLRVGDGASNVYAMGERLELVAERVHRAGITTVLCHHFKKQGRSYADPPELEDLSQSGVAEFGRQFLLLKRRKAYEWDGKHDLWFSWGGSAGHQGARVLQAYTGTRQAGVDWQTTLRTYQEHSELEKEAKEAEKLVKVEGLKGEILAIISEEAGLSGRQIAEKSGHSKTKIGPILSELVDADLIDFESGPRGAKCYHTT